MIEIFLWQMQGLAAVMAVYTFGKMVAAEKMRFPKSKNLSEERSRLDDLPSVSVCIPARNEMDAVGDCLERVLASDYPKLEILVLDDNSTDSTAAEIKAFAHAGVRFIQGRGLPRGWLGRNFALQSLLEEASGKYVLFLGVDTQISPQTVRLLVEKIKSEHLAMLSVVPQRRDMKHLSVWLGGLRYFWDLLFAQPGSQPGAVSSLWMIERVRFRDELGGFYEHKHDVQPEPKVASELGETSESALFISRPSLGVYHEKCLRSRYQSAKRNLAPLFRQSFPNGASAVGLALVIVSTVAGLISVLIDGLSPTFLASVAVGFVFTISLMQYYRLVWVRFWWLTWIIAPYVTLKEIWLMLVSYISNIRGTVRWKGRKVCPPDRPE